MKGVVDLWESGLGRPLLERGLLLGRVAEDAPVGLRNAAILELRARLFGPSIEALARCPACGEAVEISFRTDDLSAGQFQGDFEIDGIHLECRAPNSLDLAYAMRFAGETAAAREIARRCIVASSVPIDEIPDAVLEAMGERMDAEDPLAIPSFGVACPECGVESDFLFDPAEFVWRELATQARRDLADVHELAKAYGWTEEEVLKLSPTRRQMYLEMVRA